MYKKQLIAKFNRKEATVGIIGLGYVGLPLLQRYLAVGYKAIGFDVDSIKIDKLLNSESYIRHIDVEGLQAPIDTGNLILTTDYSHASSCDALIVCVPTPLNKNREPDLSFVVATIEGLLPHLVQGQIISLESTTYPGTTDEEIVDRVTSRDFEVGVDYFVVYSPEREDPGNIDFETSTIPKICGGHTSDCTDVGIALYAQAINTLVPVSSTKVAEMTKLLENIHRAVNIGLVNELKIVADKMDIDIFEVVDAAATKPFGFTAYYPGPGLGGHCIPIDPFYLTWKAREYNIDTKFIELAGEVNRNMPGYVFSQIIDKLNNFGKSLKNSVVLIVGVAYKKNVDDIRESPAIEIMSLCDDKGAFVKFHDPFVPLLSLKEGQETSVELNRECLDMADVVVIATNHDALDYKLLKQFEGKTIDTRGSLRGLTYD